MTPVAGRSERSACHGRSAVAATVAPATGAGRPRRARGRIGSRSNGVEPVRDGLAVGHERLLHRDDRDLDHVVGRLLRRDHLDEQARVEQDLDERVRAVARPELEDLVADRGDDRDEQDPAGDHDERRLPADEREREDRQEDDDDEELGAAALVGGRVLADLVDGQRVAGLEGVDRHVLGAVVLEDPADVRRPPDEHEVAEEDRDPDEALDEVLDEPVVDVGRRDAGDEQRQQEEDPDRRPASVRPSMSTIEPLPSSTPSSSAWTLALRTSQRVPTTASRTGRRGRG